MIGASSPAVSLTKVERHTPNTRPSSEEARPYRSPTDRGRAKNRVNNGDSTRWQKGRSSPATCCSTLERPPTSESTLTPGPGLGETESPQNVIPALDELGNQDQIDRLHPAEDPLSNVVEDRRSSGSLFAEVGQGCRIVRKHCYRGVGHQKMELPETVLHARSSLAFMDNRAPS